MRYVKGAQKLILTLRIYDVIIAACHRAQGSSVKLCIAKWITMDYEYHMYDDLSILQKKKNRGLFLSPNLKIIYSCVSLMLRYMYGEIWESGSIKVLLDELFAHKLNRMFYLASVTFKIGLVPLHAINAELKLSQKPRRKTEYHSHPLSYLHQYISVLSYD